MLAITPSTNAHAALRYFRENMAQVDYYCEDREVIGKWHGRMAKRLELSGDVTPQDFEALLFNINPLNGERLTARNSVNRRPMYDFTFNAPKSVSVMMAITKDEDIVKAHSMAVQKAMQEVEDSLQTQMGSGKGKHYLTTSNGIYAEFVHDTSRPLKKEVDGKKQMIPDPQLHSHCALLNATYCNEQGRFRAVELGNVKSAAPYFEALYHSFLAQNLREAGYSVEREGKRWELSGVSREVIEKYSGRTLEIEARIQKDKLFTAKQKAAVGRLTRNDKNSSVVGDKLHSIWKDRLTLSEYQSIMAAKGNNPDGGSSSSGKTGERQLTARKTIDLSLRHFMERNSGVPERRVLAYAIDLSSGIISADEIKKELTSRDNIIRADYRTVTYITTTQMLEEERGLINKAVEGKNSAVALNKGYKIQNSILNSGQRIAIKHLLESPDKIMMVSGDAGTGKTTMLQELKLAIEEKGKKVLAFAPSSMASNEVLRSKGFDGATTIAKLLGDQNIQTELKDNVMLIDEAGLVGIPTMNAIFDLAEKQNARVILSGDYKQHSAVQRGDATRILEQKAAVKTVQINEIVRQQKAQNLKQVISSLASGVGIKQNQDKRQLAVTKAFDRLDREGNITEITDQKERNEALSEQYFKAYLKDPKDVLVVSPTHREGKEITQAIREKLRTKKLIGSNDKPFSRLKSKGYTDSEKLLSQSYSKGDTVQFHQNTGGFKAGEKYLVLATDQKGKVLVKRKNTEEIMPLNMAKGKSFEVFSSQKIDLATKDKLRITKNSKSIEGNKLLNGQTYFVKGFDKKGNIELSNGKTLDKNSGHFNHGYVSTSHGSQGMDAITVLIAQSSYSFGASSDKQFYVSVSRAKENCQIFTDDKSALRHAVSKIGDRISAGEINKLAQEQKQKQIQKVNFMQKTQEYLAKHIQPVWHQMKENHEQRRTEREMGNSGLGLDRE